MKKLLFSCFLLVTVILQAQTFGGQQIIQQSDTNSPESIYAVDIDGDGDMDVLSASWFDYKISWYENIDGNGTFGPQQIITTLANTASSVYATDIDCDGDIDVLSASKGENKIAWYENTDGSGTFGPEQLITILAIGANSVYATDIDNDGDMDVLSASDNDNKIAWYENTDGNGTFGPQQVITTLTNKAKSVYATDIDNDGDMDVLSASYNDGIIAWYENTDGNGNFGPQQIITNLTYGANSVYAADIDGDGDMDVLSAISNVIVWNENTDGNGSFGAEQVVSTLVDEANSVYAADIDNDGNLDILSASYLDNKIAWYKNTDGNGNFGPQQVITNLVNGAKSVFAVDIDGDNDMDVLSASWNDDKIAWYENIDGNGSFGSQYDITTSVAHAKSVFAVDIDNDGDMDVLSASENDNKIAWYKNTDGNGTFGSQQVITTLANKANSVYAADIDGDGDMDVLSTSFSQIAWYENTDGSGVFGQQQVISSNSAKSVFAIDIDNDGDIDVLSASSSKIVWYENTNGNGIFGSQQIITTSANGAKSVYAADIDGDGDMDVLSASNIDNKIAWYENTDGNGTFGPQQVITTLAVGANSVYAADIDSDGDMDVLSASSNYNKIAWYENTDGNGNFGIQQVITTSAVHASSVYAADIDGDGDPDVLSASWYDDKIAWYKNMGNQYNEITGIIRLDLDQNGCDATDIPMPNVLLTTQSSSNSFATFTLPNGVYQLFTNIGNFTTTTTLPEEIPYFTLSPASYTNTFNDIGNTFTADFCLTSTQTINDVNISIYPLNQARPGFDVSYRIVYKNIGTTQLNGNIILEYDNSKLNFLNASLTPNSQTANSLTFDYTTLNPFETRTIDIHFNVFAPSTVIIGEMLYFTATINPISGDNTPENNVFTLNQTVFGSYDPNDFTVLEGDEILLADTDKYLHYLIRFQNTGTASAINVVVKNVLDPNLDWNTIQLESISHNNRVEIKNGNQVEFIFDNINLPDSTGDEPNSHGFIAYKIKPKQNINLGDVIANTADIFFDFNSPITTNTVTTTVVNTLSLADSNLLHFGVYPIPAKNEVFIKSSTAIKKIVIYDKLGNLVAKNHNQNKISVSELTTGIYFIKATDINGRFGMKKFIKN